MEIVQKRVFEKFSLTAHLGRTNVQERSANEDDDDQWNDSLKFVLVHEFHDSFRSVGPRD